MLTKEEIALLEATSSQLTSRPIDGGLVRKAVAHIRKQDAALAEVREIIELIAIDLIYAHRWLDAHPAPAKEK